MALWEYQQKVQEVNDRKGYTSDLLTLTLGVCEEAGELAKAVNMKIRLYVPKAGAVSESIEHEIGDLLVYIFSVANSAGIDLDEIMEKKLSKGAK